MDIQHATYSFLRQPGTWPSCFAAFGFAPLIRPPPMMCHYYRDLLSEPLGSSTNLFAVNKIHDKSETDEFMETIPHYDFTSKPRIAIVGGGIAGVTAANALSKKLSANNVSAKIVVFEGDEYGGANEVDFSNHQQPSWVAGESMYHIL